MVRQAATRKFGLSPKNRKAPFKWAEVVMFATTYGVLHQGYCHLVVSSMAILLFGGMCRYSNVSRLRWRNLRLDDDGNLHANFNHGCRKNSQFRLPPTLRGKCVRSAFFESLKSLLSRTLKVLFLEASTAAWWLRAQARHNLLSKRSSTTSSFDTCRYGSVKYLEPPLKSFASILVLNQAAVAEHPRRPTR